MGRNFAHSIIVDKDVICGACESFYVGFEFPLVERRITFRFSDLVKAAKLIKNESTSVSSFVSRYQPNDHQQLFTSIFNYFTYFPCL